MSESPVTGSESSSEGVAKTFNEAATLPDFFAGNGMPAERIAMYQIKELLRLKYESGLSFEKIGRALKVSKGVVAKYVKAAHVAGLDWPQLRELDDEALERPRHQARRAPAQASQAQDQRRLPGGRRLPRRARPGEEAPRGARQRRLDPPSP